MQPDTAQISPATDKENFLRDLRAVTSPAHKKLEESPLSKAIVSEHLRVEDYAAYLEKMSLVMRSFEKEIFPLLNPYFSDLDKRSKIRFLENDLRFLQTRVAVPASSFKGFSAGHSIPYLMGAFYVLEGSTLGGKFIYKNINTTLSFDAEHGASYFNGYGAETGKLWSAFMEQFCSYAMQSADQKDIIKGADDTFKALYDLLTR